MEAVGPGYEPPGRLEESSGALLAEPPAQTVLQLPPPVPRTEPPWGPVVLGGVSLLALGATLGFALAADGRVADGRQASRILLARESRAQDAQAWAQLGDLRASASALETGAWASGVAAAVAAVAAVAWYWLLPPEGGWKWASGPTSVRWRF